MQLNQSIYLSFVYVFNTQTDNLFDTKYNTFLDFHRYGALLVQKVLKF